MAGGAHRVRKIFFFGQVAEGGLQRFDDLRLKGRVHRPDGQRTGKAGRMGVRNIKIELQAVLTIITKYGNALGSTVDPAAKLTIPALHLKDRRGVRALSVDQNLIIEGAFVVIAGRAEKARPALIAAGNALHSLVIQLCDKLKFGWQGSHLLSLRLRPLFYCKPVILLLFFLGLFKWLPLIAINIKLVITFNWRTAEHIHIPLCFHHESARGKQRTLDGADLLIPVAVAVHAVEVPQRGVRLFPQPV